MQILTGFVLLLGFFLEIWDLTKGIDICQEAHPPDLEGVNICGHSSEHQESLIMDCRNESIVIKKVYIGSKAHNPQCQDKPEHGTDNEDCCKFEPKDILFDSKCPGIQNASGGPLTHFIYSDTIKACSGQEYCDKNLAYQFPLPDQKIADYVRVVYDCIPDEQTIGFCESRTVTGSSVNLRYDEKFSTKEAGEHECSCRVTSSGSEPIKISALDIRLQEASPDMECQYTKLSVIDSKNKHQIYRDIYCLQKEFIFGVPVLNSTTSKDFRISLGPIKKSKPSYPSFVWLQVAGISGQTEVTVQCSGPTTETGNVEMLAEYIVIAVISAVILTGVIVTIVALCRHKKQREYKPPQPENIYFELETPDEKYDEIRLKQMQDSSCMKHDPSYGRLNFAPDESHYDEPDKLNGKLRSFPVVENDYATPDLCRS